MANKKIKVNYYYPTITVKDIGKNDRIIIYKLDKVLEYLKGLDLTERVYDIDKEEDNIQLKVIKKIKGRWELGFLRNTKESIFKGKLNDNIEKAEVLDDDEFIGHECCMIYDIKTNVISLQSNIRSISYRSLSNFLNKFIDSISKGTRISITPITLKPEYCNISEDPGINYKNIVLNYLDISEVERMAKLENNKSVENLAKISNNLGALKGKIELSVGRSNQIFLGKKELKTIVNFFKKYPRLTNGLKVKIYDEDSIRMIDLIENKLTDEFNIPVAKDDVKTFKKILFQMSIYLEIKIKEELKNCVKITE